jgi:acetyl esterase/lipase
MAMIGRSAGAQLAMVAAFTDPAIRAVVDYYGPVNLTRGWREPPRPDPIGSRSVLEAYMGGTPDQVPERYVAASPIEHISNQMPAALLIYGARDHIVQIKYGRDLHEHLKSAGASVELVEIPWADHAFDAIPGGLSGQLSLWHTERFLNAVLGR